MLCLAHRPRWPRGRHLWITGLAAVLVVTGGCAAGPRGLNRPNGVAVAGDGSLLVVDRNHYRVVRLDDTGAEIDWFGGLGDEPQDLPSPYDIAVGPEGRIYVCDRAYSPGGGYKDHDGVKVFSADGRFLREVGGQDYASGDPTNGPYGLDVGSSGNVYIADYHRNRIRVYDSRGELLRSFGERGAGPGQFSGANDVVVDEERGFLYVIEAINARVQKLTLEGEHVQSFGHYGREEDALSYPQYADLDGDGNIYVSDMGNRRVKMYDASGNFVRSFAPTDGAESNDWQLMGVTVRQVRIGPRSTRQEILAVDTLNNRILVFDESARVAATLG
jgi:sugar lactone lactonase YvrE